ncbi:MAG: nucleoside hydrolase [Verrucomicrobiota bacterium]
MTVIAVGPLPNIAEALKREPRIAKKAKFVGMHGSVRRGYGGKQTIDAEWNVRADPQSCQAALSAPGTSQSRPRHLRPGRPERRTVRKSPRLPGPDRQGGHRKLPFWSTANNPDNKVADTHSSTLFRIPSKVTIKIG